MRCEGDQGAASSYAALMRRATVIAGIGRVLLWLGAVVLAFVVYQLWGTGLVEARAQDDLEERFDHLVAGGDELRADGPATSSTVASPAGTAAPASTTTTTTTTTTAPPPSEEGDPVARIVIPAIGVDKIVVEGVSRDELRKGPGHYPGTPLPGQSGNAAIAGHRTTYGAPFHRIDELSPGDEIELTTVQGSFDYRVTGTRIVSPDDVEVISDQGDDRLTLTSCHPRYSDRERIVVTASLDEEPAPARPREVGDGTGAEAAEDTTAPEDLQVLDGAERGPVLPAVVWGAVVVAVWSAILAVARRWRRFPAYLAGAPVLVVSLFVFFEAVADTLPSNF
jgi:sortase A